MRKNFAYTEKGGICTESAEKALKSLYKCCPIKSRIFERDDDDIPAVDEEEICKFVKKSIKESRLLISTFSGVLTDMEEREKQDRVEIPSSLFENDLLVISVFFSANCQDKNECVQFETVHTSEGVFEYLFLNGYDGGRVFFPSIFEMGIKKFSLQIIVEGEPPEEKGYEDHCICSGRLLGKCKVEEGVLYLYENTEICVEDVGVLVGTFDIISFEKYQNIHMYCYPGKEQKMIHVCGFVEGLIEFFVEMFKTDLVEKPCNFVFVNNFFEGDYRRVQYENIRPVLSIVVFSSFLLFDEDAIDQGYVTKFILAERISFQMTYECMKVQEPRDLWLVLGFSQYIAALYLIGIFGNNEIRFRLKQHMDLVCARDIDYPSLCSEWEHKAQALCEFNRIKACVVFHMIEGKIGRTNMLKFLQLVFLLLHLRKYREEIPKHREAADGLEEYLEDGEGILGISTQEVIKIIKKTSGHDLTDFVEQWVSKPGVPHLFCSFVFNKKKSVIELLIRQYCKHVLRNPEDRVFSGQLKIRVYEFEGTYDHMVNIDGSVSHVELPYHSKYKKPRLRRKDDMLDMSSNSGPGVSGIVSSPIGWIRIDPDMTWIRSVELQQPDFMWHEQLCKDVDVVSQCESIVSLLRYPNSETLNVLERIINDWKVYYQIRCMAMVSLASMSLNNNTLREEAIGILLGFFESKFCVGRTHKNEIFVVKPNNFENFTNYFLEKTVLYALSKVRDNYGKSPTEIQRLLVNLLKFNENQNNMYSDSSHISVAIWCLSNALVPSTKDPLCRPDVMLLRDAVTEIERCRFLDAIEPKYHNAITTAVLHCVTKLQFVGMIEVSVDMYLKYLDKRNFIDVRISALESLLLIWHDDKSVLHKVLGLLLVEEDIVFRRVFVDFVRKMSNVSLTFLWIVNNDEEIGETLVDLFRKSVYEHDYPLISLVFFLRQFYLEYCIRNAKRLSE